MGKQKLMKTISILGFAVLALGACQKGGGSTADVGTPAIVSTVPDMNSCSPARGTVLPDGHKQWKIRPYSRQIRHFHRHHDTTVYEIPNDGLCECPGGFIPTCSPQGLMCVPMNAMSTSPVVMWAWTTGYNGGMTSYSYARSGYYSYSYSYHASARSNQPSCANSVALSCSTPGQISGDLYCQAVAPNSPYGVWTRR